MEKRRRLGFVLMGVGVVVGLIAKAVSGSETFDIVAIVIATLGLVGGGVVVGLSYRSALPRTLGTSRASLLASSAATRFGKGEEDAPDFDAVAMETYIETVNQTIARCEYLLETNAERPEVEAARERLVELVANPRYGYAIEKGRVNEARVREVSGRLAAAL